MANESDLVRALKAEIESHDLQPFTTPHLSRIRNKAAELLELLTEPEHKPGNRDEMADQLAGWWTVTKASAQDRQRDIRESTQVFVSQRRQDMLETLTDEQVQAVNRHVARYAVRS